MGVFRPPPWQSAWGTPAVQQFDLHRAPERHQEHVVRGRAPVRSASQRLFASLVLGEVEENMLWLTRHASSLSRTAVTSAGVGDAAGGRHGAPVRVRRSSTCLTCQRSPSTQYSSTQRIAEILPDSIPQSNGVSVSLRSSSSPCCSSTRRTLPALSPNCLLYTSPSPRDGLLSRMPSSA